MSVGIPASAPAIKTDVEAAIGAARAGSRSRARHPDAKYHIAIDRIGKGEVTLGFALRVENVVDVFRGCSPHKVSDHVRIFRRWGW